MDIVLRRVLLPLLAVRTSGLPDLPSSASLSLLLLSVPPRCTSTIPSGTATGALGLKPPDGTRVSSFMVRHLAAARSEPSGRSLGCERHGVRPYTRLLGCGEVLFFYTPRASVCSLRDGFNRSSKKYSVPTTGVVEERNPLPANALEGEGRGGRRDTPSPVAARCSVRDAARGGARARAPEFD